MELPSPLKVWISVASNWAPCTLEVHKCVPRGIYAQGVLEEHVPIACILLFAKTDLVQDTPGVEQVFV